MIELDALYIVRYDEKYKNVIEEFDLDSKSKYINEIRERLEKSKYKEGFDFNTGYIVLNEDKKPIGYIYISGIKNDNLYLEYAVLKNERNKGYGKKILNEVTNYLFNNYNISCIKLDIDKSNIASINTAEKVGFFLNEEDFENNNYNGKLLFEKDNMLYINKKIR